MQTVWFARIMKLALVLFSLGLAARIASADPVTLDYRTSADTCSDGKRFADEVSTKLGFVPWSPSAAASVFVRVERDGEHFTGSVRNRGGSSKIVDAATCGEVVDSLAASVAANITGHAEPSQVADDKVAVTFVSGDDSRPAVGLRTGNAYGSTSKGATVSATVFEDLCTSPCTTRVARGDRELSFNADNAAGYGQFHFDQPVTITATRKSRHDLRTAIVLTGLAMVVAGVAAIESDSQPFADGGPAPILGTIGISVGAIGMFGSTLIPDTFTLASAPTQR